MPDRSEEYRWYQLSTREQFAFLGFIIGFIATSNIEKLIQQQPLYLECLPILTMLLGAGIGELVKRRRTRDA
jgi:hypothetical protein